MDIEKVIDQLATYSSNNIYYAVCPGEISVPKANKAYQLWKEKSAELVAYVRDLEARQFRWIPVSEGLPVVPEGGFTASVVFILSNGVKKSGWWIGDGFMTEMLYTYAVEDVTHYAYIPELEELK